MTGRRLRLGGLFALPISLSLCSGCFPQTTLPVTATGSTPSVKEAPPLTPEKNQPRREPQAATCVAFGNLQLEAAVELDRPPAQRQDLYEMARKYFQQALKTDPKCRDAYLGLAKAYQGLENYERTIATYEKAEKVFPKDGAICYDFGMFHARHKHWAPALEKLKAAVDHDPDNRSYVNAYGFCLARAGRYDECLAFFKARVGEARAHYNVARMLHHAQQDDACKQHLQTALQIDPKLTPASKLLAELNAPDPAKKTTTTVSFESLEEAPKGVDSLRSPANSSKK